MIIRRMAVDRIDEKTYERFLKCSPETTVFHSSQWLDVLRRSFGVTVGYLGVFGEKGKLVAVCPVEHRRLPLISVIGSPLPGLFTPYQGLVWGPGSGPPLKRATLDALGAHVRAPYFRMQWQPGVHDQAASRGLELAYTAVVDLTVGEPELLRRMKGETRNQVRQAFRRGVRVEFVDHAGDWIYEYVQLSEETYQRQGLRSPMRAEFLRFALDAGWGETPDPPEPADMVRGTSGPFRLEQGVLAALASVGGDVIAASLIALDRGTAYYLDNVSVRKRQQYRANNAIVWETMRWAAAAGLKRLDLVGANIPSVAAFKLGFGACREGFPVVTSFKGLGKPAYVANRWVRHVVQSLRRRRWSLRSEVGGDGLASTPRQEDQQDGCEPARTCRPDAREP